MRVIDFFDKGVLQGRGALAVYDLTTGEKRTYAECWQRSHAIARGLRHLGVRPETTKVAVFARNSAIGVESVLGVMRSGAVWVPINTRNSVSENAWIMDRLDVEVLIWHSELEDDVKAFRSACPKIRSFVLMDGQATANDVALADWLAAPFEPVPELVENRKAPFAIFGSGGTTGKPKGVVHSHATWDCLTANLLEAMPVTERPVHLAVAPLTHAAASLAFPLFAKGASQLLMRKFDAADVLDAIEAHRVSHVFVPPTALYMLIDEQKRKPRDVSSLRYLCYGAAPASIERIKEALGLFGPVLNQFYGQAEAGPLVGTIFTPTEHARALAEAPERLASCGRPTLLTKLRIVDEEGKELPIGETGVVAFGGEFQMIEYYQEPEQTNLVRRDGWILTGDVGRVDEDGFVYITDRRKEMIITGGFNVYPSVVEQAVFLHPAVQDCAVVGVPDEKWGEAVKAVVVLRPGETASAAEIIAICRAKLGGVMAPKSVEFWDELPKSPVGKVLRREVRSAFWGGRSSSIV